MNKTAIKNFAVWARNKLIADISYRAGLIGITGSGIASALPQSIGTTEFYDIGTAEPYSISGEAVQQRKRLVDLIRQKENDSDYVTAYNYIIEEVAYTWFNRLIAIRFMEVNDYLPSHIRVLSSESGKQEPDLVTNPFEADLDFTDLEEQTIVTLKQNNSLDELFKLLLIKQCNALNDILPELFEKTADYTELLLNVSFIDREGVVWHLINDISEDDFNVEKEGQVEIIGWLYQYYISEKHDQIINIYKGTVKKEDIPAATQLFTTDWVVRYMVDNSLGRYWIERHPESNLADKLEFYVSSQKEESYFCEEKIEPENLTFFDPCMGSGHILVYAFDVLMEIYRECGYSDRDAALSIVQNNLYGMDIDKRAYQLAYFAVMMKARSYNRRALTQGIFNNLSVVEESNSINRFVYDGITKDAEQNKIGEYLIEVYKDAQEIGTLQTVNKYDYKKFAEYLLNIESDTQQYDIFSLSWLNETLPKMLQFTKQAYIMSRKYAVVCTNPPYMGKLEGRLKEFVIDKYKPYSGDLFSVFMYRNFDYCITNGYSAFMTPFVWMFIKTYENLRKYIIENKSIATLVQMEYSAFEEATVPICSFVLKNGKETNFGKYFRLSEFKGGMDVQKVKVLEAILNKDCGYYYEVTQENFNEIDGSPIAYWASEKTLEAFSNPSLGDYGYPKQGFATGDNNRFLRLWQEVSYEKIGYDFANRDKAKQSDKKWFPCNKGGGFRRWYGNNAYLANWENDGAEMTEFKGSVIRNPQFYFKQGITWSSLTSGKLSMRYSPEGFIFESKGSVCFMKDDKNLYYILGLMNTEIVSSMLLILSPTLDYHEGPMAKVPIVIDTKYFDEVTEIVKENVMLAKADYDSFETSWDFAKHPLIQAKEKLIKSEVGGVYLADIYKEWESLCDNRRLALKNNEEKLNNIFIDIYGLKEELSSVVDEKDISINKADIGRDIRSLLSYAVGCMFGRYSLDVDGLAFAGGNWDENKYISFIPDEDKCIPITDEEYFEDDIVGLFCKWLKTVYGLSTLEDNLDFIANALGNKGNTSREIIRNYFLNDFFKDHCANYSVSGSGKRPIYWLFDSGKQNGFKAVVYMHCWNENTIGKVRVDYLHRMQRTYESEINRMQDMIDHSTNAREVAAATKRKEKLRKQLKECREYDEKIGHLALAQIDIDLDDGVKKNYDKVQTAADGKKHQILAKLV